MMLHLACEYFAQRHLSPLRPANPEAIGCAEQRREEWETLNVVPVRVSEQDRCRDRATRLLHPLIAEQPRAGSAIQDHARAIAGGELEAGCISAEMIRIRARRRNRSACTPEAQAHGDL